MPGVASSHALQELETVVVQTGPMPEPDRDSKPSVTGTTHGLPFMALSPADFEDLCYWIVVAEGFQRVEHIGASGADGGRDVVAYKAVEGGKEQLWYFQCKRSEAVRPDRLFSELDKIAQHRAVSPEANDPDVVAFVMPGSISDKVRSRVREHASRLMAGTLVAFWARTELNELVTRHPRVVARFFQVNTSRADPNVDEGVTIPILTDVIAMRTSIVTVLHQLHSNSERPFDLGDALFVTEVLLPQWRTTVLPAWVMFLSHLIAHSCAEESVGGQRIVDDRREIIGFMAQFAGLGLLGGVFDFRLALDDPSIDVLKMTEEARASFVQECDEFRHTDQGETIAGDSPSLAALIAFALTLNSGPLALPMIAASQQGWRAAAVLAQAHGPAPTDSSA